MMAKTKEEWLKLWITARGNNVERILYLFKEYLGFSALRNSKIVSMTSPSSGFLARAWHSHHKQAVFDTLRSFLKGQMILGRFHPHPISEKPIHLMLLFTQLENRMNRTPINPEGDFARMCEVITQKTGHVTTHIAGSELLFYTSYEVNSTSTPTQIEQCFLLGKAYMSHEQDKQQAIKYLLSAANCNYAKAHLLLAVILNDNTFPKAVMDHYKRASDLGCVEASNELGFYYLRNDECSMSIQYYLLGSIDKCTLNNLLLMLMRTPTLQALEAAKEKYAIGARCGIENATAQYQWIDSKITEMREQHKREKEERDRLLVAQQIRIKQEQEQKAKVLAAQQAQIQLKMQLTNLQSRLDEMTTAISRCRQHIKTAKSLPKEEAALKEQLRLIEIRYAQHLETQREYHNATRGDMTLEYYEQQKQNLSAKFSYAQQAYDNAVKIYNERISSLQREYTQFEQDVREQNAMAGAASGVYVTSRSVQVANANCRYGELERKKRELEHKGEEISTKKIRLAQQQAALQQIQHELIQNRDAMDSIYQCTERLNAARIKIEDERNHINSQLSELEQKRQNAHWAVNEIPKLEAQIATLKKEIIEEQLNIGYKYVNGTDTPADVGMAIQYFRQATNAGHQEAPAWVGWIYEKGKKGQINLTKAKAWYQLAADRGSQFAVGALVRIEATLNPPAASSSQYSVTTTSSSSQRYVTETTTPGITFFGESSSLSVAIPTTEQLTLYPGNGYFSNDITVPAFLYRSMFDRDPMDFCNVTQQRFFDASFQPNNEIIEKLVTAIRNFEKIGIDAVAGQAVAQYYLGYIFERYAIYVEHPHASFDWREKFAWYQYESKKWYQAAAAQNNIHAIAKLAGIERHGFGVSISTDSTFYHKAWLYFTEYDKNRSESLIDAVLDFRRAADQGNSEAQYYLRFSYEQLGDLEHLEKSITTLDIKGYSPGSSPGGAPR